MVTEINRNIDLDVGTSVVIVSNEIQFPTNERKLISLINNSTGGQKITIAIGDLAQSNKGIVLSPGGYYQESHDAGFTPTQAHITAISDLADGSLSIQERIIVRS